VKKLFLWAFLLITPLSLVANDHNITVGAGIYTQSQPYKGADPLILPSPVIFYDNGIFYARWSRFGLYFLGEKQEHYSWGFSLTVQPRTLGYKPSDSKYLSNMDERKSSFEGGIAFSASFQKDKYIEIMFLADMMHTYNSWIAQVEIGDTYRFGKFSFYPSFVLLYQPSKFIDYYYGVKDEETLPDRPYYKPSGGVEYGLQTYLHYPLTQKLSTLLNLRYDRLPSSASNSPLTDKSYIYSGLFSLIYTFEY